SLTENLEVLQKAARASHEEATHESSRAESKYDTRGLEAAYLGGGQARQAKEILDSIKSYKALATRDFGPGERKYSVNDKNGVAADTSAPQTIFTGTHFVRDTRLIPW